MVKVRGKVGKTMSEREGKELEGFDKEYYGK